MVRGHVLRNLITRLALLSPPTSPTSSWSHVRNSRHVAVELGAAANLQLVHARARDGLEHVRRALRRDGAQLRLALDKQEPRKAERVHAQRLAGHREPVRLAPPREDVHMPERQHHVVRQPRAAAAAAALVVVVVVVQVAVGGGVSYGRDA